MNSLYEKILSLCNKAGIRPGTMCNDIGLSRGMMTDLKMGRKQALSTDSLSKIALYFSVSMDYLLGTEKTPATETGSGRPEDEFVGFYGEIKDDLTPEDLDDIKKLMEIRAELNRNKGK